MEILANSKDPDEMQHNAAFHQGLHCLPRLKQSLRTEINHLVDSTYAPLKVHNLQSHTYRICLFDLILYVPSTIFQICRDGSSWVEPVLS